MARLDEGGLQLGMQLESSRHDYLTDYLGACGRHGGKPPSGKALEQFLPWNASPEDLRTWAQPPP
jgi:hypothetical protein